MISFFEAFICLKGFILVLKEEKCSFVIVAFNTWLPFLFAVSRASQGEPVKLVCRQPVGTQQEIFSTLWLPFNVIIVSKLELFQCSNKLLRIIPQDLLKRLSSSFPFLKFRLKTHVFNVAHNLCFDCCYNVEVKRRLVEELRSFWMIPRIVSPNSRDSCETICVSYAFFSIKRDLRNVSSRVL